jgi:hypothetical protein
MIQVSGCPYPAGTVGYITADGPPRYQGFADSLEMTHVPLGTALVRAGNYNAAHNRNELLRGAEGEWVWLLDDDHAWEPSALMRLLKHDVDIVVPLYSRRYAPFKPVIYKHYRPPRQCKLYEWAELSNEKGLIEVEAAGAGGMLIKKQVIHKMAPQVFRVGAYNGPEFLGMEPDSLNEDVGFCFRARELGFKIYCDLDVSFGHARPCFVVPSRVEDGSFSVYVNLDSPSERFSMWLFPGVRERRIEVVHAFHQTNSK